jgi:hypothetical protein
MLLFILGFVLGVIGASLVILNNKNKALAAIQAAKELSEKELAVLKAKTQIR